MIVTRIGVTSYQNDQNAQALGLFLNGTCCNRFAGLIIGLMMERFPGCDKCLKHVASVSPGLKGDLVCVIPLFKLWFIN